MNLLTPLLLAYILTINLYADKEYYEKIGSKPLTCVEQMDIKLDFANQVHFYKPNTEKFNKSTRKYERVEEPVIYLLNNKSYNISWLKPRFRLTQRVVTSVYWSHVINDVMNCKYKITTFQQRGHTIYIISDK